MACRVAGGNSSPEQLWQSLLNKKDASGELPEMRWEPYHRRDSRNSRVLNETTSLGYYIDRLEDFDAQFFGISPKEAEQMDPQQRISLEVAWEALENAGIPVKSLSGSDTAVFWGVNSDDYSKLVLEDLPNVDTWMGIGTAYCGVPNRISYHLNLMGPSSAVDAACASSLVAIHHGVQAITLGESRVAIVGGVNALCGPGLSRVLDRAGAVSSEGRCRSFDDAANGYGRGEGAAAIVLKNVSQAIQDGDHIMAIIKGTAVAQDGRTNGIMAPNPKAQILVAQNALKTGNVDPSTVGYVEAHATSTPLGDPTEVSAIASVYGAGAGRTQNDPCYIGSIKPNIGHLEAGAGAMGFIKAVLAVQKGVIPPQANLQTLNRRINWESSGLEVVQEETAWPIADSIRRAAICSYGYGGTVSHAVIEQFVYPEREPSLAVAVSRAQASVPNPLVLMLSGPHAKRPALQAQSMKEWITSSRSKHDLGSIASTLAIRRDHHDHRMAVVVDSNQDDAAHAFSQLEEGAGSHPWTAQNRVFGPDVNKGVVWVFSGHGAQWNGMGKELLQNTEFHRAIQPLDAVVESEIGISPIALLESGEFESSDLVQILTYIMQIGISAVLNSYGVFPQAVIGHSIGEIAASVVTGALTPEEGAIIVTRRSVLYRRVMDQGGMLLINKSYAEVAKLLENNKDLVTAIDTSPSSCVVAGSKAAIDQAKKEFEAQSIKVFRVKTDIAFHSPLLNELATPLLKALDDSLNPALPTRAKLYSTSLQDPRGQNLRNSQYWVNNMISPVQLTSAVRAAVEDSYRIFLEISTHPLVSHSISETLMHAEIEEQAVIPMLAREKPSMKCILHGLAQLHCLGVSVDWRTQMSGNWARNLPTTRWIHRPYWRTVETGNTGGGQSDIHDTEKHVLLGRRIAIAGTDTVVYSTQIDEKSKPFPGNHPLHGTEIVPAAVLVNTFIKATGATVLQNAVLRVPVAINAPRSVQIVAQQSEVKILSRLIQESTNCKEDSSWVTHTTAQWHTHESVDQEDPIDIAAVKARLKTRLPDDFSKDYLAKVGVSAMGFPWAIKEHYGNNKEMLARVDAAPNTPTESKSLPWDSSSWAPLLDAATSVGSTIFFDEPRLRMPSQIQTVNVFTRDNPPRSCWLYVKEASDPAPAAHISLIGEDGLTLARFTGMRFSEIEGTPGASGSMESLVHQIAWPPALPAEEPLPISQVVLISNDEALAEEYGSTIDKKIEKYLVNSAETLVSSHGDLLLGKDTAIVYIPGETSSAEDIPKDAEAYTWQLLEILKFVIRNKLPVKVFVLTTNTGEGETPAALAHAPLVGLSRVLASEHPDQFGGLIDNEVKEFPLTSMRYIRGADIIRIRDGMPRTARLRSFQTRQRLPAAQTAQFMPHPGGTYVISGGLGALGLEVADFLVEKGARRLILISRRSLPPRRTWNRPEGEMVPVIQKMKDLEARGASIHVLALDISVMSAAKDLSAALEKLSWPPVRGVVHAAGVLDNQLALDTTRDAFSRVLGPKISGGLVLHEVFPPCSVDFFILFSSCGQLVGFTGQSSYGSGNAFLDTLAAHRRAQGDASVAIQWTSWRGMGMGASTDYINAELESKGITDVTRDEAFGAWLHLAKYDTDHGVVLRSLAFDKDEPLPTPILHDIAVRRLNPSAKENDAGDTSSNGDNAVPKSPAELKTYLDQKTRDCVGHVLHMDSDEVDSKAALSDLGVDSVMTVALRRQLQQRLKMKVPPTLLWSHPTVTHLVAWFTEKMATDGATVP